ncbi:monocarboxylate transporter 7-like [Pungitius pungitius]|uniref:monocarboxylate transporter 7-like n=1 Tax=Pungitius pungitius TaxID=134920 RepID=UPI002E105259
MALCGLRGPRFLGPNVYPEAPDGGWGWVVAAAFFLVEALTYGTIKIFGIFLQDLMEQFGETNSRVSWVVSICVFVMTFSGPLSAVMTNRFGFQIVVMTGGFLIATGNIATSFTTSINQMYITYGVVAGLGYCLTFLPTVTILSQYFTRRRSLVVAVASTGESLSMFALAPAFSALRDRVGWRHTMVVIGSLQTIIVICGALLRPIIIKPGSPRDTRTDRLPSKQLADVRTSEDAKAHLEDSTTNGASHPQNDLTRGSVVSAVNGVSSSSSSPEEKTLLQEEEARASVETATAGTTGPEAKQKESDGARRGAADPPGNPKLLDFSVLGECSFILYSLFGLFATLGFFAPPLYVIELSVSRGVARDTATYMLSAMAVAEILGRLSIGWIMTRERFRRRKLQVLLVCVVGMTADLFGFTLASEFYGLAACCCFFGFFMGSISCSHIPMLAEDDVVGIERMPSAAGVYVFIQSFAGLAGPPLGGMLVDATQNYGSAFYSCAAGMALGALFLALVRPAKNRVLCRSRKSKRPEDQRGRGGDSECSA